MALDISSFCGKFISLSMLFCGIFHFVVIYHFHLVHQDRFLNGTICCMLWPFTFFLFSGISIPNFEPVSLPNIACCSALIVSSTAFNSMLGSWWLIYLVDLLQDIISPPVSKITYNDTSDEWWYLLWNHQEHIYISTDDINLFVINFQCCRCIMPLALLKDKSCAWGFCTVYSLPSLAAFRGCPSIAAFELTKAAVLAALVSDWSFITSCGLQAEYISASSANTVRSSSYASR